MLVQVDGTLSAKARHPKDVVLAIIGRDGTAGGTGYTIEFAGSGVPRHEHGRPHDVCNMAIEAVRAGLVAVDDKTIEYVKGPSRGSRPGRGMGTRPWPTGRRCTRDADAKFDAVVKLDAAEIVPQVTWGTSPEMVLGVDARVPGPDKEKDATKRGAIERARHMGLAAWQSRSTTSPSTRCSSALAPTAASKTCAKPLPW